MVQAARCHALVALVVRAEKLSFKRCRSIGFCWRGFAKHCWYVQKKIKFDSLIFAHIFYILTFFKDGILEYAVKARILEDESKEQVRNALLLKHVHQHEKEFQKQLSNGEKRSFPLIKSLADMGKKLSHMDMREMEGGTSQTPPLTAQPSSNLLTATNASSSNMRASPMF